MKKNLMMRAASVLLVAVMLTTCAISGTFAKYTTAATASDTARVAYWGFQSTNSMTLDGLFLGEYTNVDSVDGDDVIAPGTSGSSKFAFAWDEIVNDKDGAVAVTGPEVAYNFTVSVDGSTCDPRIANNGNIQWRLDGGAWGDWGTLLNSIKALSGDASGTKEYAPNTLPVGFTDADEEHTIEWQWIFETVNAGGVVDAAQDQKDTDLGNALSTDTLADVTVVVTISATQID